MGDLLGYARVSTLEQDPALQQDALHAAGCVRVFCDQASGALDQRPELGRVLDQLRPEDTLPLPSAAPASTVTSAAPRPRRCPATQRAFRRTGAAPGRARRSRQE